MEALVFEAVGRARLADLPEPEPADDEVVIRVAATGLCHTDSDILHGRYMGSYPVIPGHEVAGTVVRRGSAVEALAVGDRVAVDPLLPCGTCPACGAGRPSLCADLQAYGATRNGGFAAAIAVRAVNAHPIGDLPFARAALAEPFACVLHGIDRARVAPGARALVFGAGPIGLMMTMALQARHGAAVTMVDLEESRLDRAMALGADAAVDGRAPEALAALERFDLVVDCTGVPAVCERMPAYARDGATLLMFGVCPPDALAGFSPYEIFRRELTIVGSHSLSGNLPDALDVLGRLGERADRLVSHRLPLAGIAEQLRAPAKAGTMKLQYRAGDD